jgi:hypothetical protein
VKWVTRANCHVDRTACAWLIRRSIDPDATFIFVPEGSELPADAIPFDIPGHQFSHHDGASTFEVLIQHHGLELDGLASLGRIVHEADIEDERYDAPEAAGLDAIVRGLGALHDDDALIRLTEPIYDGLLAFLAGRR